MIREDSAVSFNDRTCHIECSDCGETIYVRPKTRANQLALLEMIEMAQLDHEACSRFSDERKARDYRAHRKEGARRRLLGIQRGTAVGLG